jgi:acyl carrier protein
VLDRTNIDVTNDDVIDRVTLLVRRAVDRQATDRPSAGAPIRRDDDLRALGLSSLGVVNLMLSVEAEFDLKIPERDMTPANFRSIARVAELVRALAPLSAGK